MVNTAGAQRRREQRDQINSGESLHYEKASFVRSVRGKGHSEKVLRRSGYLRQKEGEAKVGITRPDNRVANLGFCGEILPQIMILCSV